MNAASGAESLVERAIAQLQASAAATTELQIELCEIPAPIGGEAARAKAVSQWLRTAGCAVERDSAGNVIARTRVARMALRTPSLPISIRCLPPISRSV